MSYVFLFAGQGSQKAGMGKDFYEMSPEYRAHIDRLSELFAAAPDFGRLMQPAPALRRLMQPAPNLRQLMHEGPEDMLQETRYTQPCMTAFQTGVTELLKKEGIVPAAACGLSLGEYSALVAADVFSPEQAFRVTSFRGEAMQAAAEGLSCGMMAVIGAERAVIEEACREETESGSGFVSPVNYNCPGQIVICGDEAAVTGAGERILKAGKARLIRLKTGGPFHTNYMAPAGEKLMAFLEQPENRPGTPSIPVTSNVTGAFYMPEDNITELLARQVSGSVMLEQDLKALLEAGYRDFLEIGPGNTMQGFLKKTARAMHIDVNCAGISTAEDFKAVIA